MKDFLGALVSAIAIVLLVPTGLILASWNAIPGDSLYGVKRNFEGVALAVTVNTPLASAFSLNFTDRRFNEANRLFAKSGSTLGYSYLVEGAEQSKNLVIEKEDREGATQLIANIETYQKGIEEKKLALSTQPTSFTPVVNQEPTALPQATRTPVSFPTPRGTSQVSTPVPTPQPSTINPQQTISDLDKTDKDLEKIKDDLEKQIHEREQQPSQPGNENRGGNDKGKNKD